MVCLNTSYSFEIHSYNYQKDGERLFPFQTLLRGHICVSGIISFFLLSTVCNSEHLEMKSYSTAEHVVNLCG